MRTQPARLWREREVRRKYLGEVGTLLSWSVVRVAPLDMEQAVPYVVGLVKLRSKVVLARVVGVGEGELKVGMRLRGTIRRLRTVAQDELISYGMVFSRVRELRKNEYE